MTNTATANSENIWDFDFASPYPAQDTNLLKQLDFLPGLKEILMLRQVHALEHGTVWVLSEMENAFQTANPSGPKSAANRQQDNETLGGLSTDRGFYLYGSVNQIRLKQAVHLALQRFRNGEWDLAVHPRCGTNLSVAMLLTAGLAAGSSLLLPKGPLEQLLGVGLAAAVASQLTPDLGSLAQKYITTAIPFNLTIEEIYPVSDLWQRPAHFVRVQWQE